MGFSWDNSWDWLRSHLFRIWTATVVLVAYAYAWVYRPEVLTWWKRLTTRAIESGCGLLPYPWGDRIEATIGNFGLWVQISSAIIGFRIVIGLLAFLARRVRARSDRQRNSAARNG